LDLTTTLSEPIAGLGFDLPHQSAPLYSGRQQLQGKFELACVEMARHTPTHGTNQGWSFRPKILDRSVASFMDAKSCRNIEFVALLHRTRSSPRHMKLILLSVWNGGAKKGIANCAKSFHEKAGYLRAVVDFSRHFHSSPDRLAI
jgi:hypothetical protein